MGKNLWMLLIFGFLQHSSGQNRVVGNLRLASRSQIGQFFSTTGTSEGRLEIYRDNKWGTVCSRNFGEHEANAACRQLGFLQSREYANVRSSGGSFQDSDKMFLLQDLSCSATSSRLIECEVNPGNILCGNHRDAVVLSCFREGTVRLLSRLSRSLDPFPKQGRLEIYYEGSWASFCFDVNFNVRETILACRQLGNQGAVKFGSTRQLSFNGASSSTPLYSINCSAQTVTTSLVPCISPPRLCSHSCDVAVICSTDRQTPTRENTCYIDADTDINVTRQTTASNDDEFNPVDITWSLVIILLAIPVLLWYAMKWYVNRERPELHVPNFPTYPLEEQEIPPLYTPTPETRPLV